MSNINRDKLYRIIDANFNRAKEGLRVCEDVCRFFLDQKAATKQFKDLRHALTDIILALKIKVIIASRNIEQDVGRSSTTVEFKRTGASDLFYANAQRVKESLRVLEEVLKLMNKKQAQQLKSLRYQIYALERKVVKKL